MLRNKNEYESILFKREDEIKTLLNHIVEENLVLKQQRNIT